MGRAPDGSDDSDLGYDISTRKSCFQEVMRGTWAGLVGGSVIGAFEGSMEANKLGVRGVMQARIIGYGVALEATSFGVALFACTGLTCGLRRWTGVDAVWQDAVAAGVGFGLRGALVSRQPRAIAAQALGGAIVWPIMNRLHLFVGSARE